MSQGNKMILIDRRLFVGGSALTLVGISNALAQQPKGDAPKTTEADSKKLAQIIAEYIVGFDLKTVPRLVIDRARVFFTDSIGVMLAAVMRRCRILSMRW